MSLNFKDKIVLKGSTRERLEQLDKRETQCLKEIARLNEELRKIELDPSLLKKGRDKPEIEEKSQLMALKTLQSVIRGHSDRMDLVRGASSRSPSANSLPYAARSPSPPPESPRRRRSPPTRPQRNHSPPRRHYDEEEEHSPPPSPRRRRSPPRRESPLQRRPPSPPSRRRNNRYSISDDDDDDRASQHSSSQRGGSARVGII